MNRLRFLRLMIGVEDRVQVVYDKAAAELNRLPVSPKSRAEAKAIIEWADREAEEIIYNAIRDGADLGEEEARREALTEMKRRWKVARS